MYLPHELELMEDTKPLKSPGMGEPCKCCGWARRYHAGIDGLGRLLAVQPEYIPVRRYVPAIGWKALYVPIPFHHCEHFVPSDPNSKARRANPVVLFTRVIAVSKQQVQQEVSAA